MNSDTAPSHAIDFWLRRFASRYPGAVKFRLLNALDHFDRSLQLLDSDLEMASFRAISGEEEAAATLMKAIQLRRYANAGEFNIRDHRHKAAVIACVRAITGQVAPILTEFQLILDPEKRRADVRIPFSNFSVQGVEDLALQPVEPLDFYTTAEGNGQQDVFQSALNSLAVQSSFESVKRMVAAQANARNTLLYASDCSLPRSRATPAIIEERKKQALTLLVLSVMVMQTLKHQALVKQAIVAFLGVISRLPADDEAV